MQSTSLPIDLVLVRHGESEGNLTQSYSKGGDDRFWTPEFRLRPNSEYRLTDKGRIQSEATGDWLRSEFPSGFDFYYCSEYARAMETAALLKFEHARWSVEFFLRERSRGALHGKSYMERKKEFHKEMDAHQRDLFFWTPPDGESMATACARVDIVLDKLMQRCGGLKVLIVCHGNMMEAFRVRLEKWTQERYKHYRRNKSPYSHLYYGHVLHYSRRDPHTGSIRTNYQWLRSVYPKDMALSTNKWEMIRKTKLSNEDLMASINVIPQLVNNDEVDCRLFEIKGLEARLATLKKDVESSKRKEEDLGGGGTGKRPKISPTPVGDDAEEAECDNSYD